MDSKAQNTYQCRKGVEIGVLNFVTLVLRFTVQLHYSFPIIFTQKCSGTSITCPRITRYPAFYNKFPEAWRNPHRGNGLKFQNIECVILQYPASTSTLLWSGTYTVAQICRESDSTQRLWHSPHLIRGLSLFFVEECSRNSYRHKNQQRINNAKTR